MPRGAACFKVSVCEVQRFGDEHSRHGSPASGVKHGEATSLQLSDTDARYQQLGHTSDVAAHGQYQCR